MFLKKKIAFISLVFFVFSCNQKQEEKHEYYKVTKKNIETVVTDTGEVGSEKEIEINSPFSTKVDELLAEGTMVKKNDVIGKLSTTQEENELEKYEISYKEANFDFKISQIENKKDFENIKGNLETSDIDVEIAKLRLKKLTEERDIIGIVAAEENIKTIKREKELVTLEIEEKGKLFTQGYISESDYKQSKNKLKELENNEKYFIANLKTIKKGPFLEELEKEKINLNDSQNKKEKLEIELRTNKKLKGIVIKENETKIRKNKEKIDYYKDLVSSGSLKSPGFGVLIYGKMWVGEEAVKVKSGDSVKEGTVIAKIYDITKPILKIFINEVDISKIKLNQDVRFTLDSFTDKTYKGKVAFISPIASKKNEQDLNNISVFEVKVIITEFDKNLKIGMTANIEIVSEKKENKIVIPSEYIFKENNKKFCLLKNNTSIIKKDIKTGISNDIETEVIQGLKEGDEITLNI
ncbi:MAG: HlyD family efflux transporter periplasmic adaptor subunit [Cyanobacteriota bacterium]